MPRPRRVRQTQQMKESRKESITRRISVPAAPPGSYSRDQFGRALAPLWRAYGLRPDDPEQVARAGLVCTRLFDSLGHILPLDEVFKLAEDLAPLAEKGQGFPDESGFLPDRGKEVILRFAKRHTVNKEDLRHLGYSVPRPRRPR